MIKSGRNALRTEGNSEGSRFMTAMAIVRVAGGPGWAGLGWAGGSGVEVGMRSGTGAGRGFCGAPPLLKLPIRTGVVTVSYDNANCLWLLFLIIRYILCR